MQTESEQLFEESKKYIPGGVNSPVRAFGSVGRYPIFIKKAKTCAPAQKTLFFKTL